MDFAFLGRHEVKRNQKDPGTLLENFLKKTVSHEGDGDTSCCRCTWYTCNDPEKRLEN